MVAEFGAKLIVTYDDSKPTEARYAAQIIHDRAIGKPECTGGGSIGGDALTVLDRSIKVVCHHYQGEINKYLETTQNTNNNILQGVSTMPDSLMSGSINQINNAEGENLTPHTVWLELRLQEVEESIQRYLAVNKDIPADWVREHQYLGNRIAQLKVTTPLKPFPAQ